MALTATKQMLREQGLAPKNWRLSTAFLGKEVDVELSSGTDEAKLMTHARCNVTLLE